MHIVTISAFAPTRENTGPPTSLPYQLLRHAPADATVDLYHYAPEDRFRATFISDLTDLRLNKIIEIPSLKPWERRLSNWHSRIRRLPNGVARFPLNRKIADAINRSRPDLIWIYPYWMLDWVTALHAPRIVVTGPDSAVLHCERVLRHGKWQTYDDLRPVLRQLECNLQLERALGTTSARIHLVGEADAVRYNQVVGQVRQGYFTSYPCHDYLPINEPLEASTGRLRVVISGGDGTVYVGDHLGRLTARLVANADILAAKYEFLCIGANYEGLVGRLRAVGYCVIHKVWVENFAAELTTAHIQIFPIAVGTGTKGKVLHALATGLLGIGSAFAFENIAIDPQDDCLLYQQPEDIVEYLTRIWEQKLFYGEMARRATQKVRLHHAPSRVGEIFWRMALCF
jgi:hypothetical protein